MEKNIIVIGTRRGDQRWSRAAKRWPEIAENGPKLPEWFVFLFSVSPGKQPQAVSVAAEARSRRSGGTGRSAGGVQTHSYSK